MNRKTFLLTIIAFLGIFSTSFAQPKGRQSYNFTRALEEANKGNKIGAIEYLSKEISENPNNGYAHMTMAILHTEAKNYDDAMLSINLAIKKLPKKDKEYTGRAYATRAQLYAIARDTVTALSDFNLIMFTPISAKEIC